MNILIGAGVLGGAAVVTRVFGTGQVHEGHTHKLPTEGGVINSCITNAQGLKIRTYEYQHTSGRSEPVGVVVCVHGIGSHAHWEWTSYPEGKYENSFIDIFNKAGYNIHMLDLQGHGRSEAYEGMMNHVRHFNDFTNDVVQLVMKLKNNYPTGTSMYVMGESMGGCIVASVGQMLGDEVDGIILLAPMLSVKQVKAKPINRILLPSIGVISRVFPLLPLGAKAKNTIFPDMAESFDVDPLTYTGNLRTHMALECLNAVDQTMSKASLLTAPCLLYHSKTDTMTDPEGTQEFHDKLTQQKKSFRLLDNGMWHGLTKEPGYEKLAQEIVDWLGEL